MGISRRALLAGAGATALQVALRPRRVFASSLPVQPGLHCLNPPPRQNELIEFALVGVGASLSVPNPFHGVDTPVVFIGPDGRRLQTSAFWHESNGWRVRLLAEIPGQWFGVVDNTTTPIYVEPTTTAGVVRRRGRQLEYPDDTPYIALGTNTSWARSLGTAEADYTEWYDRLAGVGANWSRLWMCSWAFGLEWKDAPLGDYRPRLNRAALLDRVLDLGAARGIRAQLVFQNHGAFSTQYNSEWADNSYNAARGGPLSRPEEIWTNPRARNLFKRRIKYIVSRWWAHPGLLAWELWNEFDLVDIDVESRKAVQWHAEMAACIRQFDPLRRPITTSRALGIVADPIYDRVWDLPAIDFAQVHFYADTAGDLSKRTDLTTDLTVATTRLRRHGKPVIIGEADTGAVPEDGDPAGEHLVDLAWGGLFASGTGSAMPWWWDNYIAPRNLYGRFAGAFAFARANTDVLAGAVPRTERVGRLLVHHLKGARGGAFWVRDAKDHWSAPSTRTVRNARIVVPTPAATDVSFFTVPSNQRAGEPLHVDGALAATSVALPPFRRGVAVVYRQA